MAPAFKPLSALTRTCTRVSPTVKIHSEKWRVELRYKIRRRIQKEPRTKA